MIGTELDNLRQMLKNANIEFTEDVPVDGATTRKTRKPHDRVIFVNDAPDGYTGFGATFYFWHGALISMGCWEE